MSSKPLKIFVEGKADRKFVADFIRFLFEINYLDEIINLDGKDGIAKAKNTFNENTDMNGTNLLIFDADEDFKIKFAELNRIKAELEINFEIFLFPDNNDKGELEHLLSNIILIKNKKIFDCFEDYQKCLKVDDRFRVPVLKTKIYAYTHTLLSKENEKFAKEDERDYLNKEHWDLSNSYLNPLKEFLNKYFTNN